MLERKIHICLVEDNENDEVLFRRVLKNRKVNIVAVEINGERGYTRLEKGDYDVGVTDQNMPKMSGVQMLAGLDTDALPPILMYSTCPSVNLCREAMEAGAVGIFNKWDLSNRKEKFYKILHELAATQESSTLREYMVEEGYLSQKREPTSSNPPPQAA